MVAQTGNPWEHQRADPTADVMADPMAELKGYCLGTKTAQKTAMTKVRKTEWLLVRRLEKHSAQRMDNWLVPRLVHRKDCLMVRSKVVLTADWKDWS